MTGYNSSYKLSFPEGVKPKIDPNWIDKTIVVLQGSLSGVTACGGNPIDRSDISEHRVPSRMTLSAKARNKSRLSELSRAALKDELVYQLSSATKINWKTFEIIDKYHERAKSVLYRINVYDLFAIDIPSFESKGVFVINTSDISPSLYDELEQLKKSDPKGFDVLVTEAVQTILEGINKRYYHIAGLPYKVTWRFEP